MHCDKIQVNLGNINIMEKDAMWAYVRKIGARNYQTTYAENEKWKVETGGSLTCGSYFMIMVIKFL